LLHFPISVGIGPVSEFAYTENFLSDVNNPKPVGMLPYMRVSEINMFSILLILLLNSWAGRVPVSVVFSRLRVLKHYQQK